ncbi:HAD-IIA family hydrolase [Nocardiopsis coralliicola]
MTLSTSAQPLTALYDAALLDLDGVVYIGPRAVPAAPEAVAKARAAGMRVAFVTNNAAMTPSAVAQRLSALDVPAAAGDVVTSAEAAARLVAERFGAGAPVLAAGDTGLRLALIRAGLRPVTRASADPVAVVQGHAAHLGRDLIAQGALAVSRGALFVATNGDATAPSADGVIPGNGAQAQVIAFATGVEPVVAGKPMRPLHEEGVLRTGAQAPLVVGDRLDTDVQGAVARGAASMLVLSGVTTPRELLAAPAGQRPDYIAWDVAGLNEPHPEPVGWHAAESGGSLRLTGSGDRLAGLRALCAAAWSSPVPLDPTPALTTLGW